jgi:hypothetical protein
MLISTQRFTCVTYSMAIKQRKSACMRGGIVPSNVTGMQCTQLQLQARFKQLRSSLNVQQPELNTSCYNT